MLKRALLTLLLLAPAVTAQEAPVATAKAPPSVIERGLAEITAEGVMAHLSVLASDDFEGREAGTKAGRLAANYVATQFRKAGCEPFGDEGSFFQAFNIDGRKVPARDCAAALIAGGRENSWVPDLDFIPFGSAPEPEAAGTVVFVGYGISAKRPQWNDYAGVDVKGKIVLLLRGTPRHRTDDDPFAGSAAITYGALSRKVATAARNGAAGVIVVRGLMEGAEAGDRLDAPVYRTQTPAINVKASALAAALGAAGSTLASLDQQSQAGPGSGSRELPATARFRASFRTVDDLTHNVLGLIRGSDPLLKDELVVLGGHYDHVGMGRFGSRSRSKGAIHNGADDNASGTSGVITIARTLKSIGYAPRRSILFMGFSAEEKGLLGSRHYVKHPKWPLATTVAMINLDMIGRGTNDWCVACGVGTSPGFATMVERLNGKVGLDLATYAGGLAPSDNSSFYRAKIPVLFFFTGTHPEYHSPGDDPHLIERSTLEKVTRLAFLCLYVLAEADERPEYSRNDGKVLDMPRLRDPTQTRRRQWLGVRSDPRHRGPGVKVIAIDAGSLTDNAGLRQGDLITEADGGTLRDANVLETILQRLHRGDSITLTVRRGAETLTVVIQL